ncbi:DUF2726 domain-containing protein [Methylomagnum sp.]
MNWAVLGGLAATAMLIVLFRMFFRRRKPSRPGYQKRDFLLSPEERLFFATLKQAVGMDYEVFGKIKARDAISVRSNPNKTDAEDGLDAIDDQHFAFVLCDKADLAIACAVQLREHVFGGKKKSAPPVDPLKSICHAAGLPFVVIEAGPMYDVHEIKEAIAAAVLKEPLYVVESGGRREPRISGLENLEI